jgi:hypothetical protein
MNRRMAAVPPGWNASGKQITDPVVYLESILKPMIDTSAKVDKLTPTYKEADEEDNPFMLAWNPTKSISDYTYVPSLGLTRIASDADNNNCWFNSFLFCMSPSFRALSAKNRRPVVSTFRAWCHANVKSIINTFPKRIRDMGEYSDYTEQFLQTDFKNPQKEIEVVEGLIVAWFFGVNCITFATPGMYSAKPDSANYEPICETMIQSPDCKVICMVYTGNHYEPLIHATFDEPTLHSENSITNATTKKTIKVPVETSRLNESEITTVFSWTDPTLCTCISLVLASDCINAEFGIVKAQPWKVTCAAAGGRRRRRARSARHKGTRSARRKGTRSVIRKSIRRRSTRRRRAY